MLRMGKEKDIVRAWVQEILDNERITASALAKRAGLAASTVSRFMNHPVKYTLSTVTLAKISDSTGYPLPFSRQSDSLKRKTIPVVGYIGGGAEVYPIDDHPVGFGFDEVDAPPNESRDLVAVVVDGDSMWPLCPGGTVILYQRDGFDESSLLNKLCVIKVANDGPTLIKVLTKGTKKGTYTLVSTNAPPREDVFIDWAARIAWIQPK